MMIWKRLLMQPGMMTLQMIIKTRKKNNNIRRKIKVLIRN